MASRTIISQPDFYFIVSGLADHATQRLLKLIKRFSENIDHDISVVLINLLRVNFPCSKH
jgi:hypothetical protein